MSLPALENWESTRETLHQVALALGAVRVGSADSLPNDLHFSLDVTAQGLSTSKLRIGGELRFNISDLTVVYSRDGAPVFALDISGQTQISLLHAVTAGLAARGFPIEPTLKHITRNSQFVFDPALAADYMRVLNAVFSALARFRAKLSGYQTPLVMWPHHFDMAFLFFPGEGSNEHNDPQLAFGFAPNSTGLARPYFYAYGWSPAAGYVDIPVAAPGQSITTGYTGLYAAYDDLQSLPDFNVAIENLLLAYTRDAVAAL